MTPEEIRKLAEALAKDWIEVNPQPNYLRNVVLSGMLREMERVVRLILSTHCIVSKEKVRKIHDNELEFAQLYQRAANSCINQHCRIDYETSRDIVKSRAKILESLFGSETFKNSEV